MQEYEAYLASEARQIKRYRIVLIVMWAACVLTMCAFLFDMRARAHDALPTAAQPEGWTYGWDCCSQMDCKRVADSEIEETPKGYLVKASGTLIPYDSKKLRDSKDQYFHLCTRGGKPDGEVICLYRAPRGM